ncbi:uncharacterized protein NPIL_201291 [Nephila pilipes]|uniref:Uncharacterized protein n=1 Tax=Nephila pilipes TaxID=299642 RepID=A0A8X6NG69_NEPPI|nr:uncharacterized protein NPIL_201291 [Nephila pilipes]
MNVEIIKKLKTPTRSNFTRILNTASEILETKVEDIGILAAQIVLLEQKYKDLKDLYTQILSSLQRANYNLLDREFDQEYEAITAYKDRILETKTKSNRLLNVLGKPK